MPELQILIAAFGPDAMETMAGLSHPPYPGVEYLVSWQNYDRKRVPDSILERKDFRILYNDSIGVSNNRNNLIANSSADYLLCSDDDISYTEENLRTVLQLFNSSTESQVLTFRFNSPNGQKRYPDFSFDLGKPPKDYFVGCPEIGFNLKTKSNKPLVRSHIKFHEDFGINGKLFHASEEDLIIKSLLNKGYRGTYFPVAVCSHEDVTSTWEKIGDTKEFIETKGAAMLYLKPRSWLLRMLTHAFRSRSQVSFGKYCRWWLDGVRKAREFNVFQNY